MSVCEREYECVRERERGERERRREREREKERLRIYSYISRSNVSLIYRIQFLK